MPKETDVTLDRISADFFPPDPSRTLEISGRIFGTTFNKDPFEEKSRNDIFTFPDGPISIAHGQTVTIGSEPIRFEVSTPSTEPPRINGQWLQFGGELNNFGSAFEELHTNFIHTPDAGLPQRVKIVSGDQEIRLDFTLKVTNFF
jgi:hypothetical protein